MRLRTRLIFIGAVALAGDPSVTAQASRSKTANLQVTAEVVANCNLTVPPMSFGPYDPIGANLTKPATRVITISAQCTPGTPVKLELDNGQHNAGSQRAMASATGQRLEYTLEWRDWNGVAIGPAGQGHQGAAQTADAKGTITMFLMGRVAPGLKTVTAGSYADTVLTTISF